MRDEGRGTSAVDPPSPLDLLESLLGKNLLRREHADEPRYTMLETIREYAIEQLEASGELDATRDRCAAFFLAFAEDESEKLLGRDQLGSLGRIDAELDNLRSVLGWCRDGNVADPGLRLAGALVLYWQHRGFANEGRDWVTAMLALPEASTGTAGRARALYAAAILASSRGDIVTHQSFTQESAEIYRASGQLLEAGRSFSMQAVAETRLGNLGVARALLAESVSIARDRGDQWGLAFALGQLGAIAYQEHDLEAARRFREEAAAVARANHDRHTLALSLAGLGLVARMQGRREESKKLFHETLAVGSELNDHWTIPRALGGLAGAAVLAGEHRRAARLFGIMVAMRELSGIGEATGFFRELCERDETEARAALGSEAFRAAWEEGRTMGPERAVAYALDDA
jgi:tetratricopeptide (TPR) repeat protein